MSHGSGCGVCYSWFRVDFYSYALDENGSHVPTDLTV